MQAVLITPNGPDGSWWQGSDYPDCTTLESYPRQGYKVDPSCCL